MSVGDQYGIEQGRAVNRFGQVVLDRQALACAGGLIPTVGCDHQNRLGVIQQLPLHQRASGRHTVHVGHLPVHQNYGIGVVAIFCRCHHGHGIRATGGAVYPEGQ